MTRFKNYAKDIHWNGLKSNAVELMYYRVLFIFVEVLFNPLIINLPNFGCYLQSIRSKFCVIFALLFNFVFSRDY